MAGEWKNYLISWVRRCLANSSQAGRNGSKKRLRAKCKLNEIFMQRFLDVVGYPKLATFVDVLLNWKSHYHLNAFFECISGPLHSLCPCPDSRIEIQDSRTESIVIGIVRYSQLIIVIIANLQIDMKLISAPVERRDVATLSKKTTWLAASPRWATVGQTCFRLFSIQSFAFLPFAFNKCIKMASKNANFMVRIPQMGKKGVKLKDVTVVSPLRSDVL